LPDAATDLRPPGLYFDACSRKNRRNHATTSEVFETYAGDVPEVPELVDIEGSWKHARDGAKAGVLLPFAPEVGQFFHQEVDWTNAEDAIEIIGLEAVVLATPSGAGCVPSDKCLETRDFSPLEPEVELIAYCNLNVNSNDCPLEKMEKMEEMEEMEESEE